MGPVTAAGVDVPSEKRTTRMNVNSTFAATEPGQSVVIDSYS